MEHSDSVSIVRFPWNLQKAGLLESTRDTLTNQMEHAATEIHWEKKPREPNAVEKDRKKLGARLVLPYLDGACPRFITFERATETTLQHLAFSLLLFLGGG